MISRSWQSLDRYLQSNSKVQFTHGICPSCYAEQMKAFRAEIRPLRKP